MSSIHFNKQVFINSLKTKHMTTYLSTTIALMVILTLHGMLQGNLKPEFFLYAFILSLAFALWNLVDHRCRKFQKSQHVD
ncbi:hypothetical protein [Acinetobacter equi]|uniref:Uncharacterized protein n=1 Tax=Acinetobacter equi TaxID=1324350 RepID=A0A0N9VA86_9GAMM|nr:hypothetical protein [Acinetobacter equi]ALH96245.1 hypothetical protein AOY20_12245 [Acinetobacter equi]